MILNATGDDGQYLRTKWGSSTPLTRHSGAMQSIFWMHLSRSCSVLRIVVTSQVASEIAITVRLNKETNTWAAGLFL